MWLCEFNDTLQAMKLKNPEDPNKYSKTYIFKGGPQIEQIFNIQSKIRGNPCILNIFKIFCWFLTHLEKCRFLNICSHAEHWTFPCCRIAGGSKIKKLGFSLHDCWRFLRSRRIYSQGQAEQPLGYQKQDWWRDLEEQPMTSCYASNRFCIEWTIIWIGNIFEI